MPVTDPPPDNPARMRVHPGREWLVVLSGTAILMLGNRRFRVETDQAAEFPTMMPHAIGAEGKRDPRDLRPCRPLWAPPG
ncbi:cupin domain-containing protein [Nocardia sp. NPDC059228]|uniref:cupin domain-containing protein n=1 Tax=Nocardia sp. NPDC059228 TaxID=3346777 RepID=UPI00367431F8